MAQIFHPSSNSIARATIFGALFFVAALAVIGAEIYRSPYSTHVGVARDQPVQFSHEHHVAGLGIDCRYCHTTVENHAFAGLPATKTCMTCHSQIWTEAPMLAPVRESWNTDTPIRWTRVHDLPDFAQFNHGIHVQKGVGCSTCHGRVDQMPLMAKTQSLQMEWCIACHKEPEKNLRPRDAIFEMAWPPKEWKGEPWDQAVRGPELKEKYGIRTSLPSRDGHERMPNPLTNCSVCHY